jgi:hypothetical protein
MVNYKLTCGVQKRPLKVLIYGHEGIGKSTMAAELPSPVFIDIEAGTDQLPVARLPRPTSWAMLLDEVRSVRDGQVPCSTIVIDTADAAERLCIEAVCAKKGYESIESPGYGRGYTEVKDEFAHLLDLLSEVIEHGINATLLCHAILSKLERPDESSSYDRWSLKLIDSKRTSIAALCKEWADMVLFLDYDIIVTVNKDKKAKATGGKRVIKTTHAATYDAKNRFGLPDEMALDDASVAKIASLMTDGLSSSSADQPFVQEPPDQRPASKPKPSTLPANPADPCPEHLKPLVDLMATDSVMGAELRHVVAQRGDFPESCKIRNYKPDYVAFLIAQWPGVLRKIKANRIAAESAAVPDSEIPFDTHEPTNE